MSRHEARRKTDGKAPAHQPAPQIEYAGNTFTGNYYIKLGLHQDELAALRQIARLFVSPKHRTTGRALHLLATTALLHWEILEPHVFADQAYSKAEGFSSMEHYRMTTIPRKFNLGVNQPKETK